MKKYSWKKRLLSVLMSTSLLLPTFVQAAPAITEESVADHWAADTLLYWDSLGLFNEIPDEEFGVDKPISRGAFVHIFNNMISVSETGNQAHNFNDIAKDDWNYDDIVTAYNAGYITGYPDDTFRANALITREEMCTVVSRYFALDKVYDDTKLNNFTDIDTIQSYARDHVGALAELEVVNGYPNGTFQSKKNITYAEAVTILTRFLGYINGGSGVSGRVYYEDKPVYNADISIYENDTTSLTVESTSDLYGDYIIDVPVGTYDVTVSKDGAVYMLADVEVSGDVRTYNKIELEAGQYVTGTLVDENGKAIEGKELYVQGDSCAVVTTDEDGVFSVILPQNEDYTVSADVDGKVQKLVTFETESFEDGLDLGEITLSTGETKKAEKEKITPPYWFIDQYIRDMIDGDDDENEKPDEPEDDGTEEDEVPDYSHLPYREPKTMAELVELNGGEQPEIVVTDNGNIKVYVGKFSNIRINNSTDIISELNNLANLLNLTDSRLEFIPFDTNNGVTYKLQQVYNGVQVYDSQIIVSTDDNGYVKSLISYYNDNVKYSEINTTPAIDKNSLESILLLHQQTNSQSNVSSFIETS